MHAIRAAVVFDGERFLTDGATVLVEGDRIVGVEGPHHEPPSDCPLTTYDGTLLPGLIDGHVHLVSDASIGALERAGEASDEELDTVIEASLREQAASGVTTVRDLGDARYRTLAVRDRAPDGLPRIVAAGPPLTIVGGHCHYLGGEVAGIDGIRSAVTEHAERDVDVIKVMASGGMLTPGSPVTGIQFEPDELLAVVETAHDHDLRVLAHAHSLAGVWHALRAGVDGIEHFSCITEDGVVCPDDLLEAVAAAAIEVGPTLGSDPSRIPPADQMPPAMREVLDRLNLDIERFHEVREPQLRRLREHGIRVVTGDDAGAGPPKHHGMLWRAVTELLLSDHTMAEALASATSVAAAACGLAAETGRLAPGLAADLLVVDGDLRHDPDALARPVAVWVRGQPFT